MLRGRRLRPIIMCSVLPLGGRYDGVPITLYGAKFDLRWQRGFFVCGKSTKKSKNFGCAGFLIFPFDEEKTNLEMS